MTHSKKDPTFGYKTWQPLKEGDAVYIISPSLGFESDEHRKVAYERARDNLARFGLRVIWDEDVFRHKDPLCPEVTMNTEAAVRDIKKAFASDARAVWAIQGGRLTLRLWPYLEELREALASPNSLKPLVGFSDITSLHLYLNARNIPTVHAVVLEYGKDANRESNPLTSLEPTVDLLMGRTPSFAYKGLKPVNTQAQKPQIIEAPLIGGNLSSLHYYDSVFRGDTLPPHMLMIETDEEEDYTRMESILESLRLGTFFKNTKAIIFGQLHSCSFDDPFFSSTQERCEKMVQKFAVFAINLTADGSTFQFGHGDWNHLFPLGTDTQLSVSENGATTLTVSAS